MLALEKRDARCLPTTYTTYTTYTRTTDRPAQGRIGALPSKAVAHRLCFICAFFRTACSYLSVAVAADADADADAETRLIIHPERMSRERARESSEARSSRLYGDVGYVREAAFSCQLLYLSRSFFIYLFIYFYFYFYFIFFSLFYSSSFSALLGIESI